MAVRSRVTATWPRTLAIQLNSSSREDLEDCNNAIAHGRLQHKDLLATYVNRGIVYAAMERYQEAMDNYRTAVDLGPRTGEVYVNLGNIYLLARKFDAAIQEYTTAIELTLAQDHIAHYNRGMAYENNNEYAKAEADFRKAMELSPEWFLPRLRLERLLKKAQEQNT